MCHALRSRVLTITRKAPKKQTTKLCLQSAKFRKTQYKLNNVERTKWANTVDPDEMRIQMRQRVISSGSTVFANSAIVVLGALQDNKGFLRNGFLEAWGRSFKIKDIVS